MSPSFRWFAQVGRTDLPSRSPRCDRTSTSPCIRPRPSRVLCRRHPTGSLGTALLRSCQLRSRTYRRPNSLPLSLYYFIIYIKLLLLHYYMVIGLLFFRARARFFLMGCAQFKNIERQIWSSYQYCCQKRGKSSIYYTIFFRRLECLSS